MFQVIFTTNQWHYPPHSAGIQPIMNSLKERWNMCMGDS